MCRDESRKPSLLEKFDRFYHLMSAWFEWVGLVGLIAMMTVTSITIILTKAFGFSVRGGFDFVLFGQVVAISFAFGSTQIAERNIRVEFFIDKVPGKIQAVVNSIVLFLLLIFLLTLIWRIIAFGYSLQVAGEVSLILGIPQYPLIYSIAIGIVPACFDILSKLLKSLIEVVKK